MNGGPLASGLFLPRTVSSCWRRHLARRRGRGGGVRQDNLCCYVLRWRVVVPGIVRREQGRLLTVAPLTEFLWQVLFLEVSRRPQNDPSGAWSVVRAGLVVGVSHRPRNYPSGAKECGEQGWLRLWGVVGAPSVCFSLMVTLRRPRN